MRTERRFKMKNQKEIPSYVIALGGIGGFFAICGSLLLFGGEMVKTTLVKPKTEKIDWGGLP